MEGQYDRADVFPSLDGEVLRQALIDEYRPNSVLSYGVARDIIFGEIDIVNDSLTCVYTGLQIYLDPALDPTETAFDQDINTEHTFPRSKGADDFTFGYSDMHHLYPTRVGANSARASLPLLEVNDNAADAWYIGSTTQSNIPTSNIDDYSEYQQNVAFEPREDHKGNVARSYFYFYTMYQLDADIADPEFFEQQRETMCQWHDADPVDRAEWNRSKNISVHQGNENPFVLDCRLSRLYCDSISSACLSVSVDPAPEQHTINLISTRDILKVDGHSTGSTLYLYSTAGQLMAESDLPSDTALVHIGDLPRGLYFAVVKDTTGSAQSFKIVR